MTITVQIPAEFESELKVLAKAEGHSDLSTYVQALLQRSIQKTGRSKPDEPSQNLDETLSSVRKGFQESGLSDEEFDQLFEEARDEVSREKSRA